MTKHCTSSRSINNSIFLILQHCFACFHSVISQIVLQKNKEGKQMSAMSFVSYWIWLYNEAGFHQIDACDEYGELASLETTLLIVLRLSSWSLNGTLIDLHGDERRRLSGGNLIITDLDRDKTAGLPMHCLQHRGTLLSQKAHYSLHVSYVKALSFFVKIRVFGQFINVLYVFYAFFPKPLYI